MKKILIVMLMWLPQLRGQELLPLEDLGSKIDPVNSVFCVETNGSRISLLDKSTNILYDFESSTGKCKQVSFETLPYEPAVPLKNLKRYVCNVDLINNFLIYNDNNIGKVVLLNRNLSIEKMIDIGNFVLNLLAVNDTVFLTVENTLENIDLVLRDIKGAVIQRKYLCESMLRPDLIGMRFRKYDVLLSRFEGKFYVLLSDKKTIKVFDEKLSMTEEYTFEPLDEVINCFTVLSENEIVLFSNTQKVTLKPAARDTVVKNRDSVYATYTSKDSFHVYCLTDKGVVKYGK